MSQENVEVVRRRIEAWNRRDLTAWLDTCRSDAEIDWSRARGPLKGVYRGHGEHEAMRHGEYAKPSPVTVEEALTAYVAGMRDGSILDRGGKRYKPSTCRSYERAARMRLVPLIGRLKLSELRRRDVTGRSHDQACLVGAVSAFELPRRL